MLNVVLVYPEIPQNTGNVARSVLSLNARLHLVEPLGFSLDDKYVKRAGLDYWNDVDVTVWHSLDAVLTSVAEHGNRAWFLTTRAEKTYTSVHYSAGDWLFFGSESRGLPPDLLFDNSERALTIPLPNLAVRSLNVASSVAAVLFFAYYDIGNGND